MTVPSVPEARRIADVRAPWCVTIYAEASAWLRGNRATLRAQAQMRTVANHLAGTRAPAVILEAFGSLLEQCAARPAAGSAPSDHRVRSVGIFAVPESCDLFPLTTTPAGWVGVGDRFLVAPVLQAALALRPPVHVLAASEHRVRLIDVTAGPAQVIRVPDLPRNLAAAMRLDLTGDRNTWAHLRISEDPKERLHEYAGLLHRAVEPELRDAGALLIICAAEPLASILRATRPPRVNVIGVLPGNHDEATPDQLADLAAPTVAGQRSEVLAARLRSLESASPELVSRHPGAIGAALRLGAVDTLFIDTDWRATIDVGATGGRLVDLGDELVRSALATDAAIVPVRGADLGKAEHVAAVLRYRPTF